MAVAHFVLIHTICHGAWVWHKLKPVLEAAGHKVTALDLVASGMDLRTIEQVGSFDAYSEPLLNFLETIPQGEKFMEVFPDWKDSVFESYTNGDGSITSVKLGPYLMENYIYGLSSREDKTECKGSKLLAELSS
ncbi:hypothetical protein GH714_017887 [Hevea brasiliensis]|uniref:AB hydrolase-1 domain-containing protein n=1 Tax=Hevea brasiliensis TaxID=3981 RepID=A0A6A6K959_HEVBR|nr:hypothetical protein GH714_017887 [Hevea brasiliensis]